MPTHCKELWAYLKGWVSYVSYQGVYTHTMTIFGFCNVDDVSWGTKGATDNSGEKKFASKKMFFVSSWLFWNAVICFLFFFAEFVVTRNTNVHNYSIEILLVISIYSTVILMIKTLFAVLNHIKFYLCCCCGKDDDLERLVEKRRKRMSGSVIKRTNTGGSNPENQQLNGTDVELKEMKKKGDEVRKRDSRQELVG
jgi:hypothetical protein